ncbi:leucine-rich repeat-containing protein 69 isoform X2 [Tenrec ecaudatus]|uniref:leucine-rich repeat-containing protein 69 isoform X2 n=1 Tax=Tenrec ecaudatus TaxID=94439 RepID=UPI003F596F47
MAERLLIRALRGGKRTKIVTLIGKKIKKMPSTLEKLSGLKTLYLQNNLIPKVCPEIRALTQFQKLKLREFYCEGNPLLRKQPIYAVEKEEIWSLQEIASRLIMNQLAEKDSLLMQAVACYPQIRNLISRRKECAICGKYFLTMWLECVQFVPPSKSWNISRNIEVMPLQILICSYKCFSQRGSDLFGITDV